MNSLLPNPEQMDAMTPALHYHAFPVPGKLAITLTKPAETQLDLSLAYSPGVAEPVLAIASNPELIYDYTIKGNLVAVISNGSAILGLGNLGAAASKPVMEGKCLLFKRFAGIDAIDIEVEETDPQRLIDIISAIAVSFGGINLEDIKAPECFAIEEALSQRLAIPVFHDDQHGTAIVTAAGLLNALHIQGKTIGQARVVCVGAGAAAIACMDLLKALGMPAANIRMFDSKGLIHAGRDDLNRYKQRFARESTSLSLADAMAGADVLLGLSGPDMITADMIAAMAAKPIIFACSNPRPEVEPELAHGVRDDLIMATGRCDYPNQVNNVLCFPFIFHGALSCRATTINQAMKVAAVHALAGIARQPVEPAVLQAYELERLSFGREYILPKPTDSRLLPVISHAVREAAIHSGVAGKGFGIRSQASGENPL